MLCCERPSSLISLTAKLLGWLRVWADMLLKQQRKVKQVGANRAPFGHRCGERGAMVTQMRATILWY